MQLTFEFFKVQQLFGVIHSIVFVIHEHVTQQLVIQKHVKNVIPFIQEHVIHKHINIQEHVIHKHATVYKNMFNRSTL